MKKFLFLVLMFFLVLTACGSKEENKSKDETESKSLNKYDKIDNKKKKSDEKKSKNNDKEKTDNKKVRSKESQSDEQSVQQVKQEPIQPQEQQPVQQEPTDQEIAEGNAKVAKEHGYTGIPNGDAHLTEDNLAERETFLEKIHEETINIDEDDIAEFTEEVQEEAMARNEAELEIEGLK
ncbi:hypothetical protein [Staphylococcus nepalensis]|uniref:hypothetical protein n=2 Tax=Staphylococcus nepalensis TaxID=214473 RepID=UPI000E009049|nr:hypothetical protein [Staphylococcus nepalensis]SUM67736.1 Uncharacterised protein [Staphylococcus nepalensis]SUM95280.1 Uncharacterised protein [Staphylococcus nepalensis]